MAQALKKVQEVEPTVEAEEAREHGRPRWKAVLIPR